MTRLSCLFLLLLGCRAEHGGLLAEAGVRVQTSSPAPAASGYVPQAGLLVDALEMRPVASYACTSGRACMYTLSADNLVYTTDANGIALKLHAAQSYRTSANCAGLGSPAVGDVCYDTTSGIFRFYDASGWETIPEDDLVVHLAGTETITGDKTFSGAVTLSGTVTYSGALIIPATNSPAQTANASIVWDSDDDLLTVGTGAARKTMMDLDSTQTASGAKTFSAAAVFNGAVTAGDAAADVVTVKGTLRIENTANSQYVALTHAASTTRAVTFPDAAGEICLIAATQTLTNKTIGVSQLSGAVAVANGGTNSSTALNNNRIMVSSGGAIVEAGALTNGQFLIGSTGAAPVAAALTGTAPVTVTNGAGSSTLSLALASSLSDAGGVLGIASSQVPMRITGGATTALGAVTAYLTAPGQAGSATEVYLALGTRSDTMRKLYCFAGTAPGGADTVVFTARLNASDQALTCTITGAGTSCNDTAGGHAFAVAAGDRLSIKAVSSGVVAAGLICSMEESN